MAVLGVGAAGVVFAQIEGGDRGIAPIDSSSTYEVSGVEVDVAAKTADAARTAGWREAQRRAWKMLWGRTNGLPPAAAPGLPDSTLDSMVGGIVIEDEEVSDRRYIARLGVLFDRARTGQFLGVHGQITRSLPMLVIPVMWSGATGTSYELRNEWQRAWARFRAGTSPIDYVRATGTGSDPLLLNLAQTGRPGRTWWRLLLDQYGAADIVIPEVALTRQWPGGPVLGHFIARHGPDARIVDEFTLRAASSEAIPRMMAEGVRRVDEAYARALQEGRLGPDPLLVEQDSAEETPEADAALEGPIEDSVVSPTGSSYTVQVDTPDAAALTAAEAVLRSVPGAHDNATISLALGGTSLIRLTFEGDLDALKIALAARGWRLEDAGGSLRLRRGAPPAAAVAPPPPPQPAPAPPR